MKIRKWLFIKSRLLVFFLLFAYMYSGTCEAIESNLLQMFIGTKDGKKHFCLDGSMIEKHCGRTITIENANKIAELLIEYKISNLILRNLSFDPGALLIILRRFNAGYFAVKNCRLNENGFLFLLDYYIREKKRGEIIFGSVDVEFELNGSLQQIDLTTISRNSKAKEKERIRQIAIWLLRNNSEAINRIVIWFDENGIFGNSYNTIDIPHLLPAIEDEQVISRRLLDLQADTEEQFNSSSYSSTTSTSMVDEISIDSLDNTLNIPPTLSVVEERQTRGQELIENPRLPSTTSSSEVLSTSLPTPVTENIIISFFRHIGILQSRKIEYYPGRLQEIPKNDTTPEEDINNIFAGLEDNS